MNKFGIASVVFALSCAASANLQISIGLRETAAGGGPFNGIGGNGGALGGIEWVNLDGQSLILDGTWQQFTFNLATATYTGFAGATANGTLDGAYGVLEHIRIRNSGGETNQITLWIDDVANTITPAGGGPTTTTFGTFEGFANGTEVIFQEPRFSGSTSAFLALTPNTSGVTNTVAHTGTNSDQIDFQFINATTTNWVRLTTFNTPNTPNPGVRFDQSSVVSFWMRGSAVPEPASLIALSLGLAAIARRKLRNRS